MAFDVLKFVDELEPGVRRAFLASVYDIQDSAKLEALAAAIKAQRFEEIFEILNLRPEFFNEYAEAFRSAYAATGVAAMSAVSPVTDMIRGGPVEVRFNMRNPRAENWVNTTSSRLITEVIEETKASVRVLLTNSITEGVGPRTAALDLIGRYDRTAGRRVGGVVGLHSRQAQYVQNARSELLSGDPDQLANYLTRKRRDKRFDGIVRKAIRQGKAVPADTASRMASRYSDGLLQLRGETIARTEMLQGLHNAQDEAMQQLVDGGHIGKDQIKATWDSSEDMATRDSHRAMEGQVMAKDGTFTTGDGFKLRYPGDRSLGAPAGEIINCRCRKIIDIDYTMELRNGSL